MKKLDLRNVLVIGVSSGAVFDLRKEEKIFKEEGKKVYQKYQRENENKILKKGAIFPLIEALLSLNQALRDDEKLVEVVIISRNSPDTGMRFLNSLEKYGLDITRFCFTSGQ